MVSETVPTAFMAGDKVEFKQTFEDYLPTDSWVMTFVLVNQTNRYSYTATDNGDGAHLVTILSAASSAIESGQYKYFAFVEKAGERVTVKTGTIEVKANFTTIGYDPRSHVKKVLDAIESIIEQRAGESDKQVSVNGRLLIHLDHSELLKLRDKYKAEYASEQRSEAIAQGLGTNSKIRIRFTG